MPGARLLSCGPRSRSPARRAAQHFGDRSAAAGAGAGPGVVAALGGYAYGAVSVVGAVGSAVVSAATGTATATTSQDGSAAAAESTASAAAAVQVVDADGAVVADAVATVQQQLAASKPLSAEAGQQGEAPSDDE